MDALFLEDFAAWNVRDLVALVGTILIVLGLSNLAGVGAKKEGSNMSRTQAAIDRDGGADAVGDDADADES